MTTYTVGQHVGIVSGVQSVKGPAVYAYGTVTKIIAPWGTPEYVVAADGGGEELVYPPYLLAPVD